MNVFIYSEKAWSFVYLWLNYCGVVWMTMKRSLLLGKAIKKTQKDLWPLKSNPFANLDAFPLCFPEMGGNKKTAQKHNNSNTHTHTHCAQKNTSWVTLILTGRSLPGPPSGVNLGGWVLANPGDTGLLPELWSTEWARQNFKLKAPITFLRNLTFR